MVSSNGAWVQVGIVSFGTKGCADPIEYLGVYSRVSNLIGFIDGIIGTYAPGVLPGKVTTKKVAPTTAKKLVTTTKVPMCTVTQPCRAKKLGRGFEAPTVTVREYVTVKETVTVLK